MKKIYKLITAVAILCLAFSCTKEKQVDNLVTPKGDCTVTVNMSGVTRVPLTYATYKSAEVFEKALSSVSVIIFDADDGDKYIETTQMSLGEVEDATGEFDSKVSGTFSATKVKDNQNIHFLLVANIDAKYLSNCIVKHAEALSKEVEELTIEDFKTLQVSNACDTPFSFVMFCDKVGEIQIKRNYSQNIAGEFNMKRLAARIDVIVDDNIGSKDLEITKVRLDNRQGKSYLYEKGGGSSHLVSKDVKTYTNSPYIAKIYSYENSVLNECKAEIDLSVSGIKLNQVVVPLESIERNHYYRIVVSRDDSDVKDPEDPEHNPPIIKTYVEVLDWETKEENNNFLEDYAEIPLPMISKAVAYNYNWSSILSDENLLHTDLEEQHTKIDMTVGCPYNMLFTLRPCSSEVKAVVVEGDDWIKVEELTTTALYNYEFKVEMTLNDSGEDRVGKLRFVSQDNEDYYQEVIISQPKFVRPKLPIEYMAEYNLKNENEFCTDFSNISAHYYTRDDAVRLFRDVEIDGQRYHLPTTLEILGLFPMKKPKTIGYNYVILYFYGTNDTNWQKDIVQIQKDTMEFESVHMRDRDTKSCYSLRLVDATNRYRSAWRYKYEKNPDFDEEIDGYKPYMITIECVYLGPTRQDVTLKDISDVSWWEDHESEIIRRIVPFCGSRNSGTGIYNGGAKGEGFYFVNARATYWADSATEETNQFDMMFGDNSGLWIDQYSRTNGAPIRLFITE